MPAVHLNSELLFRKYVLPHLADGIRVLEVGPDGAPSTYQRIAANANLHWHTVDIGDWPSLTHRATSEYSFPIADGAYDVVVSGQVVEHVRMVWRWMRELARITRPGGIVATIGPLNWPYHEAPVDCWRIYPEGMRALYEDAGLDVLHASWESLEPRSLLPRLSRGVDERRRGLVFKVARLLRYPMQRSYDTVTIGRKPS